MNPIEFHNVSFSFGDVKALSDVSFELQPGEMIIITGASGSGKTVLLHLAIGLLNPDAGRILVGGRDLGSLEEEELLKVRSVSMGLVFQEDTLFTAMTVYENTAYRLAEHDWDEEAMHRAASEILRFVGLDQEHDKLPEELSIGMRRRLELARALVGWPSIMLFDEPTSGLDPINARQVLDLIIRARDIHRISSLLVTKELNQIPHLVDNSAQETKAGDVSIVKATREERAHVRVMVLDKGGVVFLGTPEEFDSSTVPAVTRLTNPTSGIPFSEATIKDPWSRKRKAKDKLL